MKQIIEELWEVRDTLNKDSLKDAAVKKAILDLIDGLDTGKIRVYDGKYNEWVKKGIILFLKTMPDYMVTNGTHKFYDNIPLKFDSFDHIKFENAKIRILPGATVRKGAFINKNSIIKAAFIDIGVYIDENVVVENFSSIGVGAYIGKNSHIESHVGIEGNFSITTHPTVIEENVHIHSHSQIKNGVKIGKESIIMSGCFIDKNTEIIDVESGKVYVGEVPEYSIVRPAYYDGKLVLTLKSKK